MLRLERRDRRRDAAPDAPCPSRATRRRRRRCRGRRRARPSWRGAGSRRCWLVHRPSLLHVATCAPCLQTVCRGGRPDALRVHPDVVGARLRLDRVERLRRDHRAALRRVGRAELRDDHAGAVADRGAREPLRHHVERPAELALRRCSTVRLTTPCSPIPASLRPEHGVHHGARRPCRSRARRRSPRPRAVSILASLLLDVCVEAVARGSPRRIAGRFRSPYELLKASAGRRGTPAWRGRTAIRSRHGEQADPLGDERPVRRAERRRAACLGGPVDRVVARDVVDPATARGSPA